MRPLWSAGVSLGANRGSLSDADLQGKVVLLDFWAVWCGPCIVTFPHLREWQQNYEKDGLIITGLTRYYSYGWDAEANRPQRAEDIDPKSEQDAVAQFAAHHELKHRLAFMPEDATLRDQYAVRGIPQTVLLDRKGTIRLIRTGSNSTNAEDLKKVIEELLLE